MAVYTWEDMERELFWTLYDDMFACRIPSDHVMVVWTLEQAVERRVSKGGRKKRAGLTRIAWSKRLPVVWTLIFGEGAVAVRGP